MLSLKTKSGKKSFKLEDNIVNVFGKMVSQGKASIEFNLPHTMLYISGANPGELEDFITMAEKLKEDPNYANGNHICFFYFCRS
jgi:hypothetical protein